MDEADRPEGQTIQFDGLCEWQYDLRDAVFRFDTCASGTFGLADGQRQISLQALAERVPASERDGFTRAFLSWHPGQPRVRLQHRLWNAREFRWMILRTIGYPVADGTLTGFSQDVSQSRESEEIRWRCHIESTQTLGRTGSWGFDLSTHVIRSSPNALRMIGVESEGDRFESFDEIMHLIHAEDRTRLLQAFEHSCETHEPLECEYRRWHLTEERWVHTKIAGQVAYDTEDNPYELQGFIQDISEHKETERRLRFAALVFEHSRSLIMITGVDRRIIQVNPAFCEVSGYAEHEVIGCTPDELGRMEFPDGMWDGMLRTLMREGYFSGEFKARNKEGHERLISVTVSAVRDEQGRIGHFIYMGEDITEQRAAQAQIHQLAYYDALTGLPNRTLLREHAEAAVAEARRQSGEMGLIFLDLDAFKNVNDSLGHPAGDKLLMEIARRLQVCVRSVDTVGRLGGDEFMIVMPGAGIGSARRVAKQLIDAFSQPVLIEGIDLTITSSVGIALYPRHGEHYADLARAADAAMYKAKEKGRGLIAEFTPSMNEAALSHLMLTSELRQAVQQQQLQLYYQPQVSVRDGRLIGVEALLRWPHPTRGLISPAEFIPAAEESGLIEPLGAWVIGEACRQAMAWTLEGLAPLNMSINCSARQLLAPHTLLSAVRQALDETGLQAERLEIEITESIIVQDVTKTQWLFEQFRDLGVRIAVDDFGIGYSSLSYLKRLPLDKLKIDRSFVRDIETNPDDRNIVAAVVALGRTLGLKVVAEGVETCAQLQLIEAMQCDEAQGYLWAKPMPADQFVAWVRRHHPDTQP